MSLILNPVEQFFDLDGSPLNDGYIYLGAVGTNPETNPITVYWDNQFTIPAAQPIRTVNGYPVRAGTPAPIFSNVDVSMQVRNKKRLSVFYAPNSSQSQDQNVSIRTSNVILTQADNGKTILASGTFTQTFDASVALGNGWSINYINIGTGVINLDPNLAENIDGLANELLAASGGVRIFCDSIGLTTSNSAGATADFKAIVAGSTDATKRARFEVDGFTAAVLRVFTLQDRDMTLTGVDDLGKNISGLIISNNAGDAVNDIDISAGVAVDSTGVATMILGATLTKRLDANWAVGNNQGGLDTGAIANSDYYLWEIKRPDTNVVDVLFSLSSTAPTMPANYTLKRLIGWIKRVGGTIVAFHAYEIAGGGIEYLWDSPTLDIDLANTLTTAARTDAVKVPLNFSTVANLNAYISDATTTGYAYLSCPDLTDIAPSATVAPLATVNWSSTVTTIGYRNIKVRTSAAGLIRARSTVATTDDYHVSTIGFEWSRR